MRIQHNLAALNTWNNLSAVNKSAGQQVEKLASGLRINRAGDDAAGLSISEKMRAQIRGLAQGARNIQDGISLVQTAEGGLAEIGQFLQRGRELAVQASNGTLTASDRANLQDEIDQIKRGIDSIAKNTEFNTIKVLGDTHRKLGIDWSVHGTPTPTSNLTMIASNGSLFVAVGSGGRIMTSTDGTSWTNRTSGTGQDLNGVNYGNGQFIAVGSGATYLRSTDGVNWTVGNFPATGSTFYNVEYDGTNYIATGDWGNIYTSSDGVSWTNRHPGGTWFFGGTATGNGITVAAGHNGGISTSTDHGITWTVRPALSGYGAGNHIGDVSFINGQFIAVGDLGNIHTSKDGITWSKQTSGTTSSLLGITWDGEKYTVTGTGGLIMTSTDAATWQKVDSGTTVNVTDVFYDKYNDKLIATGSGGTILMSYNQAGSLSLHLGANSGQTLRMSLSHMTSGSLKLNTADVTTVQGAEAAITAFDNAIQTVSKERSKLGATQNRLEYAIAVTLNSEENVTASESRIRDADLAKEMLQHTRNSLIAQAAQTMLGQANQLPQQVLQLLRG